MPQSSKNIAFVSRVEDASLPDIEVQDNVVWVSNISKWTDRRWVFDGKAVGAGTTMVTCIWDFELHDGTTLFEPQHSRLLHEARHFFWSLYADRREGRQLKTGSAGSMFAGLRRVLKWMIKHNYASFGELNSRASARFCDWLVDSYAAPSTSTDEFDVAESENSADEDAEFGQTDLEESLSEKNKSSDNDTEEVDPGDMGGVTAGTLGHSLRVWRHLWGQRSALARLGIEVMREAPFSGKSVHKVSVELATKLATRIPALPDAVAIPLMNAAHMFIATASDDLIKAVRELFETREALPIRVGAAVADRPEVIKFFRNFRFSKISRTGLPWHEPLGIRGTSAGEELRRLVDDLIDACVLITQAETGMRIGEISALLAGMNEDTGLPNCISVRPSKSGMLDLYYLSSKLTKLRPAPVQEEWLLAAAPRGAQELPDAVRAVVVLQKLLAPVRAFANSEVGQYLVITFGVPRGFPTTPAGITEPNNHLLRLGQKGFAMSFVDWDEIQLTEETRPYIENSGNCIRTHQWRKTYAQYVFQVNKQMLPAISRQFKHLSLAMTEGAYVGTSASLVIGIAEFNRNLTADSFLAKLRGTASKQEGRLAKLMEQYLPELRKIVEGLDDNGARLAIDTWCRSRDMKIFFHGYGQCIPAVAPLKAECHKRAQTVHWANKAPNYAYREPSICTGCYLFMAGEQNIEHWTKRYVENEVIWLKANAEGRGNEFRVAKTRAEQAKGYLSNLGADIPNVEMTEVEMTHEG